MGYKVKARNCHCGKPISEKSHIAECWFCYKKRKETGITDPAKKIKLCSCGNIIHVNSIKLDCKLCVQQKVRNGELSSPRLAKTVICGCGGECSENDRYSWEITGRHMIDPSLEFMNSMVML